MKTDRTLLVTSALPYANGNLHLGHLLEHILCDIWVRTHKMLGLNCISLCADDAHGTPIMLKALNLNITPEELTENVKKRHIEDFKAFYIEYDCYHTTHSEENRNFVEEIYNKLNKNGHILQKTITQAYDPIKNVFLPDRYVKGTCPKCKTADQYGDNCENCGATYSPTELLNPVSALSGATPIEKESVHYFFDLPQYEDFLRSWVTEGHVHEAISHKLEEWFEQGLKPWDISRDAPYFGFLIPGCTDKYFYVWLDAPIGYMAACKKYCDLNKLEFNNFWNKNSEAELYHFIGKDIIYFHALFWPSLLLGSGYRLPTAIFAHGFLTVDGQKMSKSRNTFIEAEKYLEHLNPEYLRYYFAAKLNDSIEDLDLNFTDFTNRINADLIGKTVNIASRCAKFLNQYFDNTLTENLHDDNLYQSILNLKPSIINSYCQRDYAQAIRYIMDAADLINQYIDSHKPWQLIKTPGNEKLVHEICSMGINLFRLLMIYLNPVLPKMAEEARTLLHENTPWSFADTDLPLKNHKIKEFKPLMLRVDPEKIKALFATN